MWRQRNPPRRADGRISALIRQTPSNERPAALVRLLGPRTSEANLAWILELARIANSAGLPVGALRRCTSELAWHARGAGQRLPTSADYRLCEATANSRLTRLTMAYIHGERLRSDYRFAALAEAARDWLPDFPDDALIRAFAAFGALGGRHDGAQALLNRALAADDADQHCRLVCLQGLWFATHLPDQPQQLLDLSEELIGRGEDTHGLYYWRTSALRRLGRLDEAVASIDRAIDLLPAGHNEWHQDYVRERELVATTQFVNDHISEQLRAELKIYLDEVRSEIERQSADARKIVSSSLLSLVEVLGIFVAITGFLIASGAVVFRATGFWDSFAAVGLLLGGALAFFLLLRSIVRFQGRRR